MCARFTLTLRNIEDLASSVGVPVESTTGMAYRPRYNVAPLQWHWIVQQVREDRAIVPARWGLLNSWARDEKSASTRINARAETIDHRPAFRDAFRARRCVVPADGFFEWSGPVGGRKPTWFHRQDGGLVLFAAIYEPWMSSSDQTILTFTIVTTAANTTVARIHSRMPVILSASAVDDWLNTGERNPRRLKALLAPASDDLLIATPVSSRLNSVSRDDPDCLSPSAAIPLIPDC